jgi:uncharacterized protein (TIGR00369 family)
MPPSSPYVTGFNKHLGIRIAEWESGRCVIELDIEDRHLNRAGVVHGGVISSLIDAVTSHAGNFAEDQSQRRRSVTISMSLQFVSQANPGTLRAVGTRTGGGKRVFFARGEIFGEDGALVACGDMTGRLFS